MKGFRLGKIFFCGFLSALSVLFVVVTITADNGSIRPFSAGKLFYENIPQRGYAITLQSLRVEWSEDRQIGNSLQEDDWIYVPLPEFLRARQEQGLQQHDPVKREWFEATTVGMATTAISLSLMYGAGVRFDWV